VAGVVGWDERAFAAPDGERPPLVGLEAVVVRAQPVHEVEQRDLGLGPRRSVVSFEAGGVRAAFGGAGRVDPLQRGLLRGGGFPAQVGDALDLLASGGDGVEYGAGVEEVGDGGDGDGAVADEFAGLAFDGCAAEEGVEVDADEDLGVRLARCGRGGAVLRMRSRRASWVSASGCSWRPAARAALNRRSRIGVRTVRSSATTSGLERRWKCATPSWSV
jgi:hypothetical protein